MLYPLMALRLNSQPPDVTLENILEQNLIFPDMTADQILGFDTLHSLKGFRNQKHQNCMDTESLKHKLFENLVTGPHKRFRRCAIVGSGGDLRHSGLGQVIDSHDVIVRLNHHDTSGHEKDVGTKTTIRIYYPESADLITKKKPADFKVMLPFKMADWMYLEKLVSRVDACDQCSQKKNFTGCCNYWKKIPCSPDYENATTFRDEFYNLQKLHASRAGLNKNPSIGFTAFIATLAICDEISVYGTRTTDKRSDGTYYCAYDGKPQTACVYESSRGSHDFHAEHEYYELILSKRKNVQFQRRGSLTDKMVF